MQVDLHDGPRPSRSTYIVMEGSDIQPTSPWSWVLSSVSNILLFAVLFAAIYAMYRRKKSKRKRQVGYRTIQSKKAETLTSEDKIKALVTGGSGALGREIVHGLIADGHYQIYSLDLFIPDEEDRNDDVYYIQADITDRDSLRMALKDIEVVFHTAGIIPNFVGFTQEDFSNVIATGTKNVVAMCIKHNVKRLIYTSSVNVMLSKDPYQVTENLDESTPYPDEPKEDYGRAKIIAEQCVLGANETGLILTCALRPCYLADAVSIKSFGLWYFGDGSCKQMMIPVDTAAQIHIISEKKLLSEDTKSAIAGNAYIVAYEDAFTHRELAKFVESEQGKKARSLPVWALKMLAYFNEYVYKLTGFAPVSLSLRVDMLDFITQTHTYSSALGRRHLGWEDNRTWKDVVRELINREPN